MQGQEKYISDHQEDTYRLAKELQDLVGKCIAGDRTAQKEIYDKYSLVFYGVIKRYIFNNESAAEVLNDAFYKILTRMHLYSGSGPFEGWMRAIVVHSITDHLRKYIKHEQTIKSGIEEYDVGVEEDLNGKLNWKELLAIIHELPDVQRAVFNLYVFEGYQHKEIGALLGLSENNSRWHLNAARKKLKQKISLM